MLESRPMRRAFATLGLATAFLAAASSGKVEITAEPTYHLALENPYVRVFAVEVPPGGATLMHCHRHDYVAINLGRAEVLNQVEGKPPVTVKLDRRANRLHGKAILPTRCETWAPPLFAT